MSPKYTLNLDDAVSLAKNALLVGTAALLTYVIENINTVDWGQVGVLLVPVVTVALDTFIKWIKGPRAVETK